MWNAHTTLDPKCPACERNYQCWCDELIAQEARIAARERARIGHERVDLPWRLFRGDPRCAPGVLVWFDDAARPLLIGDTTAHGSGVWGLEPGQWVREICDARPMLERIPMVRLAGEKP